MENPNTPRESGQSDKFCGDPNGNRGNQGSGADTRAALLRKLRSFSARLQALAQEIEGAPGDAVRMAWLGELAGFQASAADCLSDAGRCIGEWAAGQPIVEARRAFYREAPCALPGCDCHEHRTNPGDVAAVAS